MPQFSLRQILIAIVALAAGLAIARLPAGSWFDIPLIVLSFYFVVSLLRQATATHRLAKLANLSREQRWGSRILVVALVGTAVLLILAWAFAFLEAAELWPVADEGGPIVFVVFRLLLQDLAVLAMLVAIGFGSWQRLPAKPAPPRETFFAALAGAATLVLILVYWTDGMLIWYLVYVTIAGVEAAQSTPFRPPELNVSAVLRMQRFALGGAVGLALVLVNLLLITALVKWWQRPRWRCTLLIVLGLGFAAQCVSVGWIAGPGLRQLSPPLQESMQFPPLEMTLLAAAMLLLGVAAFSWRVLAKPAPFARSPQFSRPSLYLHECWLGCFLLGMVAAINESVIDVTMYATEALAWGGQLELEVLARALIYRPESFIWLAATIGGSTLAWVLWKRRKQPTPDLLPSVDPILFVVLMASLLVLIGASAPIVAAVGFSYWFIYAGIL